MKTIIAALALLFATSFAAQASITHGNDGNDGGNNLIYMLLPRPASLDHAGALPTLVKSGEAFDLEVTATNYGYSELQVTDAEGHVVRKVSITLDPGVNRLHIKVKELKSGLHFVRIQSEGKTLTRAFEVR